GRVGGGLGESAHGIGQVVTDDGRKRRAGVPAACECGTAGAGVRRSGRQGGSGSRFGFGVAVCNLQRRGSA
ncbi:hypothetical protein, partial [Escherichia coli]|uniref:hypothetical protein n=1 Tax=Escherichia coli TaxID=562 RepID=UPI0019D6413B